jgi:hypothetical protein
MKGYLEDGDYLKETEKEKPEGWEKSRSEKVSRKYLGQQCDMS